MPGYAGPAPFTTLTIQDLTGKPVRVEVVPADTALGVNDTL